MFSCLGITGWVFDFFSSVCGRLDNSFFTGGRTASYLDTLGTISCFGSVIIDDNLAKGYGAACAFGTTTSVDLASSFFSYFRTSIKFSRELMRIYFFCNDCYWSLITLSSSIFYSTTFFTGGISFWRYWKLRCGCLSFFASSFFKFSPKCSTWLITSLVLSFRPIPCFLTPFYWRFSVFASFWLKSLSFYIIWHSFSSYF